MNSALFITIVVNSMLQLGSGSTESYFSFQGVCLNGGTVVLLQNDDYRCACKDLYSGSNCEYCECDIKTGVCTSLANGLCRVNKVIKPGMSLMNLILV